MKRKPQAIDGFVQHSSGRRLGQVRETSLGRTSGSRSLGQQQAADRRMVAQPTTIRPAVAAVSRREVDESLKDIDDEVSQRIPRRRGLLRRKQKEVPARPRRKLIKRLFLLVLSLLAIVGIFLGGRTLIKGMSVFQGDIFGILQNQPLKEDAKGRSNILVFGTSGSVDDSRHEGANLTDTLMVVSISQTKKDAYMVSLPRDLYVQYGDACPEGNSGKINSMFDCFSNGGEDLATGVKALSDKVEEVTGLTTQYYAHINWAVVTQAVDAVGGVDVDVQGNGYSNLCSYYGIKQGGVVDVNMKIKYNPGVHHMNGTDALMFSRARGSAGECGLASGDFDRQANQQKVLKALQAKAVSAETLVNFGKVSGLVDALGDNLQTNFETSEVRTLLSLAKDIPSDKVQSISLIDDENRQIGSGNIPGAGSIQVPVIGTYEYSGIHSYIQKNLNANAITKEEASLVLLNASGLEGLASRQQAKLESKGFTVTATYNAPTVSYMAVEVYDVTGVKVSTKKSLAELYGVTVRTTDPPIPVVAGTDFVIVFSSDPSAN